MILKKVYIIRHCEAEGQHMDAPLTEKGYNQAGELCNFFANLNIERIITSPYKRARESIQPFANFSHIEIEHDNRLSERVLSNQNLPDWFEKLKLTFQDMELKLEGGESSYEAMSRIIEVIEEAFHSKNNHIVIVTHGNLLSLLLKHCNENFGFDDWQRLSNPDIFLLENSNNNLTYKRLWS
ncbi:histidine phosphatase family protein [Bacillus ndiopicus]|uniref:histidine phosphatase family protein n=1 Tax=Bacillus ndiopicus TaxID=1347368 RepID=UPI002DD950D8|nr:histidine phosphatase family protein [Bacillus ndiopicus]